MVNCPFCDAWKPGTFTDGVRHLIFLPQKELGSLCNFRMYQCMKCKAVFIEEEDCDDPDLSEFNKNCEEVK